MRSKKKKKASRIGKHFQRLGQHSVLSGNWEMDPETRKIAGTYYFLMFIGSGMNPEPPTFSNASWIMYVPLKARLGPETTIHISRKSWNFGNLRSLRPLYESP